MPDLVGTLVWLIVFVAVGCVLLWIVDLFPNPPLTPTPRALIKAALALIVLVAFLRHVGLV